MDNQKMRRARVRTALQGVMFALSLVLACALLQAASLQAGQTQPASASKSSGASSTTASTKKKTSSKKHHSHHQPIQKAPTKERITEIQSALSRAGYLQGEPNGKWDSTSVSAMQKFQSDNGLESNGKINALSLQKMGLGSDVAGVSAPKPVRTAPASAPPSSSLPPVSPATSPTGVATSASNSALPATSAKPPQQ